MEAHGAEQCLHLSPQNYLKNAIHLLGNEQLQDALQAIDAAIVFSNNSPFYIYQKIKFLFKLGAHTSCSQFIFSQLEYLYKHGSLYIVSRSIDYYQKINQLTTWQLIEVLKQSKIPYCMANIYTEILTTRERPYLKRAKKAMVQDHYRLCICYCDLYLKTHPLNKKILYMKAHAYHMLNELETAISFYKEYIKLSPMEPNVYVELASAYMELRKYSEALEHFQKASYMEPTNKEYLSYIGECYLHTKNYPQALATYQTVAKYHPNDIQNCFNLSHTYLKAHKKMLSNRYLKKVKKQLKQRY